MQRKRLIWNTGSSLLFQATTIICGFIIPQLILRHFGSDVNGLVNSITQFLQIIAFLELGVGSVLQSALYKPLFNKDDAMISKIVTSGGKFFKNIARILLIYVVFLTFFLPTVENSRFSFLYTALLVIAMSISSFSQYYFGVVDRLLLTADQRGYIQYNAQTITLLLNTVACVILIGLDCSIQFVKLSTSIIYLIRPIILRWYVNRHYSVNRRATYTSEPIKQKWNGVAQHVSAVILDSTDTIVLTLFSSLASVSIYSVYFLVVSGVKQLFTSLMNGIQSLMGEVFVQDDKQKMLDMFAWVEWSVHTAATFVWGCTLVLILPFIHVYTLGITDANYYAPLFAVLITVANGLHSLRLPYNIMILAAGHYKQTQSNYIIAAILNILISIITVKWFGLIGVALGSIVAMSYQTIWMAHYNSMYLSRWPFRKTIKQFVIDILAISLGSGLTGFLNTSVSNYITWIILAFEVALIFGIEIIGINLLFYTNHVMRVVFNVRKRFLR